MYPFSMTTVDNDNGLCFALDPKAVFYEEIEGLTEELEVSLPNRTFEECF